MFSPARECFPYFLRICFSGLLSAKRVMSPSADVNHLSQMYAGSLRKSRCRLSMQVYASSTQFQFLRSCELRFAWPATVPGLDSLKEGGHPLKATKYVASLLSSIKFNPVVINIFSFSTRCDRECVVMRVDAMAQLGRECILYEQS